MGEASARERAAALGWEVDIPPRRHPPPWSVLPECHITCPICGTQSHHPAEIGNGWCSRCRSFTYGPVTSGPTT
jgi:hypothetical protein